MNNPPDKEAVLYSFAIEETHDRSTLERYLKEYPSFAAELVDLAFELRADAPQVAIPAGGALDPSGEAAWEEFLGSMPSPRPVAQKPDLFARFRGPAFAALARALNLPRSILIALRDGLVVPTSVPRSFLRRFGEATDSTIDFVRASLTTASEVPASLAFKSDTKPSPQGQVTFRQLVLSTEMTDEQRLLLLKECDDDDLA